LSSEPGADRDLALQKELAASYQKLGEVQGLPGTPNLGDTAGALESFQRALAIETAIAKARPGDFKAQVELVKIESRLGYILDVRDEGSEARRHAEEAVRIAEALYAAHPMEVNARRALVAALGGRNLFLQRGDPRALIENIRRMQRLSEELNEAAPNDKSIRRDLALTCKDLGGALERSGDLPSAIAQYQRAIDVEEKLMRDDANSASARRELSYSFAVLGSALFKSGDTQQALLYSSRGLDLLNGLAEADPSNADLKRQLVLALGKIGPIQRKTKDWPAALSSYRRAEAILRSLPTANSVRDQSDLAKTYHGMGRLHIEWALADKLSGAALRERIDQARGSLQRALTIWSDLRQRGVAPSESQDAIDGISSDLRACEALEEGTGKRGSRSG
ncbi:MAG TPA: hypothetical protein VN918_09120, partial [Myxococcaceae bacterium]|nr:hypothetical protein [Myxococcaceae bacterium]